MVKMSRMMRPGRWPPLERLDGAGMIVRLDLERDGQAVADVNDARVFLARADQDSRRLGGKSLKERRVFL